MKLNTINNKSTGFTIVELLITIVIISLLSAIVLVSYRGITAKANEAAIQSDLANASKKLAMYYAEYGVYPDDLNGAGCPTGPKTDTNYCIKLGSNTSFDYTLKTTSTYDLTFTKGTLTYKVTESKPPLADNDSANWIIIGSQKWAKANLNVGTMVTGATEQTNNSILEKYCYNNDEANCTANGAFYQWNEAMQYVTTEKAQGVCPAGSHIPSDNEWKTLEMQLGMTQAQADTTNWRGTDQGTQLKPTGSSGLNLLLAGNRNNGGSFSGLPSNILLWSSSESSTSAWYRQLATAQMDVNRNITSKLYGFSIRCLAN